MLDIWSSDDEGEGHIDLWKSEESEVSQPIGKVKKKEEEIEPTEPSVEEAESSKEKTKKEETIASVCELLMHSRNYREALVLALD